MNLLACCSNFGPELEVVAVEKKKGVGGGEREVRKGNIESGFYSKRQMGDEI